MTLNFLDAIASLELGYESNYVRDQRYFAKEQAKTTGFNPTNECADFWSAAHSYNFIIRVK